VAPLLVGVGQGDARVLVMAGHRHFEIEAFGELLAGLAGHPAERAGDGGGAERVGAGGQRDVAFSGQQAGGGVDAYPARPWNVGFRPGVQVGEVDVRAAGPVQALHVGLELDQVAGDEAGGDAQMAEELHGSQAESRQEPLALIRVSSGLCTPGSMRIR
jgi:hypothetical protein